MALPGNRNAAKDNRIWGDELRMAIARNKRAKIRKAVEALLDKAADGDLKAMEMIADRTDGRPAQSVEHSGAVGTFVMIGVPEAEDAQTWERQNQTIQ